MFESRTHRLFKKANKEKSSEILEFQSFFFMRQNIAASIKWRSMVHPRLLNMLHALVWIFFMGVFSRHIPTSNK